MLRYVKFYPLEGLKWGQEADRLPQCLLCCDCQESLDSSFCHCDASEGPWNLGFIFISFMKNITLSLSLLLDGKPALILIKSSWKGLVNAQYGPAPNCACFLCFILFIPFINSSNPQNNFQKVSMTIFLILDIKKGLQGGHILCSILIDVTQGGGHKPRYRTYGSWTLNHPTILLSKQGEVLAKDSGSRRWLLFLPLWL